MFPAILIGALGLGYAQEYKTNNSSDDKQANDVTNLLYNMQTNYARNILAGNWPWMGHLDKAPATEMYYRQPTPYGAQWVDWTHEGNQQFRTDAFKENYRKNYSNAYSTELAQATRTNLVGGFWFETITKGKVLQQENNNQPDFIPRYNPNGVNLYLYKQP